jgi:prepilin-type N-terminal cleavage/methylation domain-containing protein
LELSTPGPSPSRPGRQAGFTLIEVMVALLVAMIGLIGTVAVQQAVLNATTNANDSQVAMRLAVKTMEDFTTRKTQTNPFVDMLAPIANGTWTAPAYLDTRAHAIAAWSSTNRWQVRTRVINTGVGLPYDISVQVTYSLDTGTAKTVTLDLERRKPW